MPDGRIRSNAEAGFQLIVVKSCSSKFALAKATAACRTFSLPVGCERIIIPPTRAGARDNVARRFAREIARDARAQPPEIFHAFASHSARSVSDRPILGHRHFETSFHNSQSSRLSPLLLSRRRCSRRRSPPAQQSQMALAAATE